MIILLNGSINAGKTTVARQLKKLLPQTAHVEVDSLNDFIDFLPLEEAIPIDLENAVSVTRNFVARGFNVIVTYPLGDDDYRYLIVNLQDIEPHIFTFTLSPPIEVALTNRGQRKLTKWELQRIPQLYADNRHNPPFGVCIDNSGQTPQETAGLIFQQVQHALQSA